LVSVVPRLRVSCLVSCMPLLLPESLGTGRGGEVGQRIFARGRNTRAPAPP